MNARSDSARPARGASSASIVSPVVDLAVVGGGIVGAAAALAGAQAGLSVVWAAGSPTVKPSSGRDLRVYALGLATQRFLERLRVWPQLDAARLAPVFDMRIYGDRAGRSALHFGAYEAATERLATIVEHGELVRVLETALAYTPGVERIDGLASDFATADDAVSFATDGGVRRARLLVVADGARSTTRDALGIGIRGGPYAQRAVVGNFLCARPHAGTAFQWFTDDGVIALLPLASSEGEPGALSLVWSAPDALAAQLIAEGPDALAARLSALCAAQPATAIGPLTSAGAIVDVPLALQWARRLIAPRAALVGDAAHVVHPLAGQGLNLGLADVEALLDIVAARPAFRDCGDAVLLRGYERSRAEPVFAMRRMTDGLVRLFGSQRPELVHLRHLGLGAVDRVAPLKRLLMSAAGGRRAAD